MRARPVSSRPIRVGAVCSGCWTECAWGGLSQDVAQALRWFRLSAAQGDADALYNLGFMYGVGEGVPADPSS